MPSIFPEVSRGIHAVEATERHKETVDASIAAGMGGLLERMARAQDQLSRVFHPKLLEFLAGSMTHMFGEGFYKPTTGHPGSLVEIADIDGAMPVLLQITKASGDLQMGNWRRAGSAGSGELE